MFVQGGWSASAVESDSEFTDIDLSQQVSYVLSFGWSFDVPHAGME